MILHTICTQNFVTFPSFLIWHRLWMAILILAHWVTLHSLISLSCPHQANNFWIVVLSLPLLIQITMVSWLGQTRSQVHHHRNLARTQGQYGIMLMLTSTRPENWYTTQSGTLYAPQMMLTLVGWNGKAPFCQLWRKAFPKKYSHLIPATYLG